MSYFTRVEFLFEGDAPDFDAVAECVRAHFDAEQFAVDAIILELRRGWPFRRRGSRRESAVAHFR